MIPSLADLRLRWRDLPRQDYEWSWIVYRDEFGMVWPKPLLCSKVPDWASERMADERWVAH